jgi:RNA polymerase-binding protein DksA
MALERRGSRILEGILHGMQRAGREVAGGSGSSPQIRNQDRVPGRWTPVTERDLLLSKRDTTTARIASLQHDWQDIVDASTSVSTDDEHDPEGATIAFERAQIETLIEQARQQLIELDDALSRLEGGGYGICEDCGQPIAVERLEVRPTARTCIGCASRRR